MLVEKLILPDRGRRLKSWKIEGAGIADFNQHMLHIMVRARVFRLLFNVIFHYPSILRSGGGYRHGILLCSVRLCSPLAAGLFEALAHCEEH